MKVGMFMKFERFFKNFVMDVFILMYLFMLIIYVEGEIIYEDKISIYFGIVLNG